MEGEDLFLGKCVRWPDLLRRIRLCSFVDSVRNVADGVQLRMMLALSVAAFPYQEA